ncbi:MAG: hypothetical protein R3C10_20625 [Pirellulales bacterium]|nr:hypothetical protein [Planctomycetales bacterium]
MLKRLCATAPPLSTVSCALTSYALILTLVLAGCGNDEPAPVYEPQKMRGDVDPAAPSDVQVRQQALIKLFDEIMQRISAKYRGRDVVLAESDEEFFEGFVYLRRWEWAGPPDGDDLSVKLVLMDGDEETLHEVTRVYTVTGSGPFTVRRKE